MHDRTLGDLCKRVISQQPIKHSSDILDIYSNEAGRLGAEREQRREPGSARLASRHFLNNNGRGMKRMEIEMHVLGG